MRMETLLHEKLDVLWSFMCESCEGEEEGYEAGRWGGGGLQQAAADSLRGAQLRQQLPVDVLNNTDVCLQTRGLPVCHIISRKSSARVSSLNCDCRRSEGQNLNVSFIITTACSHLQVRPITARLSAATIPPPAPELQRRPPTARIGAAI